MTPGDEQATGEVLAPTARARFRCVCGRSVVAPADSRAADQQRCSSCRRRRLVEQPLHRTDVA